MRLPSASVAPFSFQSSQRPFRSGTGASRSEYFMTSGIQSISIASMSARPVLPSFWK
jgi:hypothetical protein